MREMALAQVTDRLLSLVDGHSGELSKAETNGFFPREFIDQIAETGFFSLTRPRQYAGQEVEYEGLLQLVVRVAERSGSLAWCLMLMAQHNIIARGYPKAVGEMLFSSSPLLMSTSFHPLGAAVREGDAYLLSGSWSYATGIHFVDWMVVDAEICEGVARKPVKFVVPASEFTVNDDWHVHGMCASGSNSISLDGCRVPAAHCITSRDFMSPDAILDLPRRYRIPNRVMVALGTVAPMVGMLKGMMVDALAATAATKQEKLRTLEDVAVRNCLLDLGASVSLVEASFQSVALDVTQETMRPNSFELPRQYEILVKTVKIAAQCRAIASEIFPLCGTKACFRGSSLHRRMMDIHTMSTHYLVREPVIGVNAALVSLGQ